MEAPSWPPRLLKPRRTRGDSPTRKVRLSTIMSRRPDYASHEVGEPSLEEEEEVISGTGEGDEVMEDVEEQEDGYSSSTPTSTLTWISWFCAIPGHEYFCEVAEDFIEDDFNLTGLNAMVPFWKEAMEMVLDVEPDEDTSKIPDVSIVEASAELLYGLVHQRYILTRAGLQAMCFWVVPRVYCNGCNVVPCGRSDVPGFDTVKLFCPNCNDIYTPPSSRYQGVDGAFFGTTFAHLFFQSYRELAPAPFWKPPVPSGSSPRSSASSSSHAPPFVNPNSHGGQRRAAGKVYIPKIYGFRVSERAKCGPRMQWMRLRPESPEQLDMVDWRGRWIDDDDDEYDDDEEEVDEDRPMEDFDPDVAEGEEDEEEEEEEEEEEAPSAVKGRSVGTAPSDTSLQPPSSIQSLPSPTSSVPPRTPLDDSASVLTSGTPTTLSGGMGSKLRQRPPQDIKKNGPKHQRKGIQSARTKFVRSVVREVAGFSPYERRVMELLRNSKDKKARKLTKKRLGTLLRSKRKLEELGTIIQESRRAH
ncbi:Casein kinase II subunit beta-1 [Grifola frondosa]|uniref:Multifunctional fusion protein n=1 Tax=Grifola frondosa TaxID=5627 RepID=A0A1C7M0A3_GRIFR|nr:Casein kinase II subunit beta-1 [Grifola frondosa]